MGKVKKKTELIITAVQEVTTSPEPCKKKFVFTVAVVHQRREALTNIIEQDETH